MYIKVCNTDLLSHKAVKCELALVCTAWPWDAPETHKVPNTHDLSHGLFLIVQSVFLADNSRGSVTPIQLSIAFQVSTTEIQCQWERCPLTQPLQNNEAPVEWNVKQKHCGQYLSSRQGGAGRSVLLLYGPYWYADNTQEDFLLLTTWETIFTNNR